jgi:hypothetical protein
LFLVLVRVLVLVLEIPDPPWGVPTPLRPHRHPLSASRAVLAKPVLNGLHHDYRLAPCST